MEGGQVLLREKKRGQVIIRRVLSKKGADGRCGGGRWRKGGRGVREMSDDATANITRFASTGC